MGVAKRKQAKTVIQYDLNGNFIKEWESKGQAALWIKEQTNKTSNLTSQIKDCILGRQKTAFGYKWKYKQYE
jgi:predicted hydrocarbon binding protein